MADRIAPLFAAIQADREKCAAWHDDQARRDHAEADLCDYISDYAAREAALKSAREHEEAAAKLRQRSAGTSAPHA